MTPIPKCPSRNVVRCMVGPTRAEGPVHGAPPASLAPRKHRKRLCLPPCPCRLADAAFGIPAVSQGSLWHAHMLPMSVTMQAPRTSAPPCRPLRTCQLGAQHAA